jgi:hypothetical protein
MDSYQIVARVWIWLKKWRAAGFETSGCVVIFRNKIGLHRNLVNLEIYLRNC